MFQKTRRSLPISNSVINREIHPHPPAHGDCAIADNRLLPQPSGGENRSLRCINYRSEKIGTFHSEVRQRERPPLNIVRTKSMGACRFGKLPPSLAAFFEIKSISGHDHWSYHSSIGINCKCEVKLRSADYFVPLPNHAEFRESWQKRYQQLQEQIGDRELRVRERLLRFHQTVGV